VTVVAETFGLVTVVVVWCDFRVCVCEKINEEVKGVCLVWNDITKVPFNN